MAAYSNVVDPLALDFDIIATETVVMQGAKNAYEGITRKGAYPTAAGGYVAGIVQIQPDTPPQGYTTIATLGIVIVKVAAGVTIDTDMPIAIDTTGKAIPATGTHQVLGHSLDASTGGSTNSVPHYVRVALNV